LTIDPTTPATIYVGTYANGVFKSTNSGGTWAAANTGLESQQNASVAVDPTDPATIYAGAFEGGVFKSTNSGGTWVATNTGLTSLLVFSLAIDPTAPTTLYAGTIRGGVFRSTDSGGTWAAINIGLTNSYVTAVALDPTGAKTLYAGFLGGSVWQLTTAAPTSFYAVTPCRIFDTRDALLGGGAALGAGSTTTIPVAGHCGVPPTATAVAVNVAITAPSGPGYLTLFAEGTSRPTASNVNYSVGQTRANNAVASLGTLGALSAFVGQSTGNVQVILDVTGYFR